VSFDGERVGDAQLASAPKEFPQLRQCKRPLPNGDRGSFVENLYVDRASPQEQSFDTISPFRIAGQKIEKDARIEEGVSGAHSPPACRT
jgi:hypothetical protein